MNEFLTSIISPMIVAFGTFLTLWWQSGKLKSDNRADFESFKNDIRGFVEGIITKGLEDVKSSVNKHDIIFLDNDIKFNDIKTSLCLIQGQNQEQTEMLKQHERKLSMYNDNECFRKEIRDTVNHSLDVLGGDDKMIAGEYLYMVCQKVIEMVKYVQINGLTTLQITEFDAFTSNATKCCWDKFASLYGSDRAKSYFKSTLPVHSYKQELFELIADSKVNNIERRFRTLTIKWLEELCSNFIRTIYIKKGVGNGNSNSFN